MKVLQLIDSLDAGGAERIAVTFANGLARELASSHLCVTRTEGVLKEHLVPEVSYCFLRKRSTLDLRAVLRLRAYIKLNEITILHAHTTSYFFATLVKLLYPGVRLIWHTHLGDRIQTKRRNNIILYFCSYFFTAIIAVNNELKSWCQDKLATKSVHYLPNFVPIERFEESERSEREQTIVCLANLKIPKNHMNLIRAFEIVSPLFPGWKLLLAGKDFGDSYSEELKRVISKAQLQNKVVFLGQQQQVEALLSRSAIGVLASDSEGLPMALLEYGAAGLAVVVTRVGECETVVGVLGKTVRAGDTEALAEALSFYISNKDERTRDALQFRDHIRAKYSVTAILPKLLNLYTTLNH